MGGLQANWETKLFTTWQSNHKSHKTYRLNWYYNRSDSTVFLGGFVFGWAKPVPVNWRNLRNPRRDMALVAIAGPLANLSMALFWALITKITILSVPMASQGEISTHILSFVILAGDYGILINLVLMVLNLLPIPPLDGSRVFQQCYLKKQHLFIVE